MKKMLICSALALSLSAMSGHARQPLHENPTVKEGFYQLGLADEVRKNCETISPRMITAWSFLRGLQRYALEAGYSEAEIEELVENKAEKEKLRAQIRADLRKRGASPRTPEGYCTVGREEIAKDTAAGRLLRAR